MTILIIFLGILGYLFIGVCIAYIAHFIDIVENEFIFLPLLFWPTFLLVVFIGYVILLFQSLGKLLSKYIIKLLTVLIQKSKDNQS